MAFLRTLIDGAKLVFVVVPRRPARPIGADAFWATLALLGVALALEAWFLVDSPRRPLAYALHSFGFVAALSLLLGWLGAHALRRPALIWPIATLMLASQFWIEVLMWPVEHAILPRTPWSEGTQHEVSRNLWIVLTLVSLRRALDYLAPERSVFARSLGAIALGAGLLAPLLLLPPLPPLVHSPPRVAPEPDVAVEGPVIDPERVLSEQPQRVEAELAALAPQRPGIVDLYVVAFGGDGSERVFRNEVEYVEQLFATRFDAADRVVALINSPGTVGTRPLATRTNLRHALRGIGERIDRNEDLVLLFLTTHGSEDHELYVALDPLPLAQLGPDDIDTALDEAGIDWRIVVVSACYSGGFIPALAGPRSLVISAARADRTSFGCGAESEFTYFGRALLIEGLNASASPIDAFAHAAELIAKWEREEDLTRSHPQISSAPAIEARIARWLAQFEPGPRVPFVPPDRGADDTDDTDDIDHTGAAEEAKEADAADDRVEEER
ncbi:MAG TPA: C13 family peptidase [Xanthomonadales bacterium]|nr:C13 family peptidase [Xanthomonadales bacterium]